MNTIFLHKDVVFLPGLVTFAVLTSGFSAMAQTVDTANTQQLTESAVTAASPNQLNPEVEMTKQNFSPLPSADLTTFQQLPSAYPYLTPMPGTVATSSDALVPESFESTAQPSDVKVAQSDIIDVGRPTRGGRSYIGIGANIGLSGGDSSLGDGNFAVLSKVGLTNTFSVRPSAVFGNNVTILVPVTYDFSLQQDPFSEPLAIAPYVGVGAAITTGNNSQVAFLVSGGVDVPITSQFTATAAVNAGFFDQTDVGLLIGIGYNFTGF
ncbi:hypothetical protein IQ259_11000 [Fortiea sp. LEGE XX443]|uniref:hypothetical protein n=1 Tax=Fortiea sp. LEGE XX443 TaxID=1828611 RepID=UPI00187F9D3A|nr:hypothetical protein [Fortiea sp. LEGE XX443]